MCASYASMSLVSVLQEADEYYASLEKEQVTDSPTHSYSYCVVESCIIHVGLGVQDITKEEVLARMSRVALFVHFFLCLCIFHVLVTWRQKLDYDSCTTRLCRLRLLVRHL